MYFSGSKLLPFIDYDEMKGLIKISGRSISPDVLKYFNEFMPYLEDCIKKQPMNMIVTINLEYFSSKSAQLLLYMFNVLKKFIDDKGFTTTIKWVYEKGDEDILEDGKNYEELTKMKFEFIEI